MKLDLPAALVLFRATSTLSKEYTSSLSSIKRAIDVIMADPTKANRFAAGQYHADSTSASTFGTTLFSEICNNIPSGNVLISPLSVYKALALVKDGATLGSDNEAELKRVLGPASLIDLTKEEENKDADVQLTLATSLWANDLKQSFVDKATSDHSAEALPLPARYTSIDDWIEQKTDGMIQGFLGDDRIPDDIKALIVNAVYFKGAWTYEFDPDKTIDGDFILRGGEMLPTRFMTDTRGMGYIEQSSSLGGASAVTLDYGRKASGDEEPTEFTSLFVLPATSDIDSMNSAIAGLKSRSLSELLEEVRPTNVNLKIPRFRLEFGTTSPESLKPALVNMGMKIAFDDAIGGKFDEMSYFEFLTVEDVLHGAVMEVTEAGTEASAASVVPMRSRSARPPPIPGLVFDRPFLVAVIHRKTGTPVFIGRVEEPREPEKILHETKLEGIEELR